MDQIRSKDRRIKTVTMALGDFMKAKSKIIDMSIIPTSAGLHRIHRWWKHAEVLMYPLVDYIAQIHAYVKYPEGDFDIKEAHATALRVIRMEEMINIGDIRWPGCDKQHVTFLQNLILAMQIRFALNEKMSSKFQSYCNKKEAESTDLVDANGQKLDEANHLYVNLNTSGDPS